MPPPPSPRGQGMGRAGSARCMGGGIIWPWQGARVRSRCPRSPLPRPSSVLPRPPPPSPTPMPGPPLSLNPARPAADSSRGRQACTLIPPPPPSCPSSATLSASSGGANSHFEFRRRRSRGGAPGEARGGPAPGALLLYSWCGGLTAACRRASRGQGEGAAVRSSGPVCAGEGAAGRQAHARHGLCPFEQEGARTNGRTHLWRRQRRLHSGCAPPAVGSRCAVAPWARVGRRPST